MKVKIAEHPGVKLRQLLKDADVPHKVFAPKIGMHNTHFSNLLNGGRHISATLAIRLEKLTAWSAEQWMTWQMRYDLSVARKNKKVRRRLK